MKLLKPHANGLFPRNPGRSGYGAVYTLNGGCDSMYE
jgi:hypothetical protein